MDVLLEADTDEKKLDVLAYQYDIVCNGVELSSGAIRNHKADVMYKAFEIAGYGPEVVEDKFAGMINAFKFGAPPHGGIAPGVDRIVMLLAGTAMAAGEEGERLSLQSGLALDKIIMDALKARAERTVSRV